MIADKPDNSAAADGFVSDTELARALGVGEDTLRVAIKELEKRPIMIDGAARVFPGKDPLFAHKRYLPEVRAYLNARARLKLAPPQEGNHETQDRRRPGLSLARPR